MQMAPRPPPSFFKILLDPSAPHLSLPPAFVSRHLENKIPKNPTLRSATGGYSWRLKIKQIGKSYCFAHGWNSVVEDTQLGFGDFLVFWLLDQSTFKVSIYGPNGCEKDLPSKIEVEDDGGGVDDHSDGIVDEDEGGDGDGDGDGGGGDDDDDDGDIDGDDGDPFFMTIISKTHNTLLRLPAEFVGLAGIDAQRIITLKNLDGEEWRMGLRSEKLGRKLRYYLSSGWPDFRRSNVLLEGDECVFKFIRSEGKLSLAKVTKKKAAARQPLGEIPAPEVVKRKRGRPPLKDGGCLDVESEDDCVEVVKRARGRPPLQISRVIYF